MEQQLIYVTIGNSDDKLSQVQWTAYMEEVDRPVRAFADVVHGAWFSAALSPRQNACWGLEIGYADAAGLRSQLDQVRRTFGQNAVAWATAELEMIE